MWPFKKKVPPSPQGMTVGDIYSYEPENPYGHDLDIKILDVSGEYCQYNWADTPRSRARAEKISSVTNSRQKKILP